MDARPAITLSMREALCLRVNEGSTAYLSATILDKAGAAQEPLSVTYRVQ